MSTWKDGSQYNQHRTDQCTVTISRPSVATSTATLASGMQLTQPEWLNDNEACRHPRGVEASIAKRPSEGRSARPPTGESGIAPPNALNADASTVDQSPQASQTQLTRWSLDRWQRDAACRGRTDLDWIDPPTSQQARCRAVCVSCPVVTICRTHALVNGEPWGIWGGLNPAERAAIAEREGHPIPAVLPAHGTNPRYAKHRCRCLACRRAHTTYERIRRSRIRQVPQSVDRHSA